MEHPVSPSISERGYARPELLADTEWLASGLDDPQVRIVDARAAQEYAEGHIAGAVNLDGFGGIPRAENNDMAPPEEFARIASALGIGNDQTVVVYDTPSQRMGMVAWAFLYYGHQDVRILDGGITKWQAEGRPLTKTVPAVSPTAHVARPVEAVYCSLDQAKAAVDRDDFVFWDTRSLDEYEGERSAAFGTVTRLGHLPGAAHLDWVELLDPDTRTLKPADELREMLAARGITPDKQVAGYCQGGARGALGALVLQVLGYSRATTYAGSYLQWSNQPDTRVDR
ncbi:MAG: sulfurtransferase [Dehalococcoidia bacterium]|nr:sulfurtransferase [Dehalococcoidia bacterium]